MPIRPTAVAGLFYPACPDTLAERVDDWLAAAKPEHRRAPKVLVAPHSSYAECGDVMGAAWAEWREQGPELERVVVLGPSHRVPVLGVVADGARWMQTPLGSVQVDRAAVSGLNNVGRHVAAHALEHAVEVQLPFLQRVATTAQVVPLVVGRASTRELIGVLEALWGGDETGIVVSSDLSHGRDADAGAAFDLETARRIEALDADGLCDERACASVIVSAVLQLARRERMHVERLALTRSRSAGHGAWGVYATDA